MESWSRAALTESIRPIGKRAAVITIKGRRVAFCLRGLNGKHSASMRRDFIVLLFILMVVGTGMVQSSRRKRYLIFPGHGSKLQFIVGTGVPIPLENHAITMGWVIKSMYLLPTNASEITDSYVSFQKRSTERRASRYDFYRTFENAAESFGGGGKECMLRTICEASRVPLKASGLIGQIIRVFVLPSSTDEVPLSRSDMDYHNAELLGKEKDVDCRSIYPSCSFSLFDMLTVIM